MYAMESNSKGKSKDKSKGKRGDAKDAELRNAEHGI